jgi:hypothetical protein
MPSRRARHDFKVHGLRPDPCFSVDGLAALVEFQKEIYIRIGTGIAPHGRSEESDTSHAEILEWGCDALYEGCRFFGLHDGEHSLSRCNANRIPMPSNSLQHNHFIF